jgi:hypothetical protein
MDLTGDRINNLRQEITDLAHMNTVFSRSSEHSTVEQSASKARASRLLEIKEELLTMRNSPARATVWWDKQ